MAKSLFQILLVDDDRFVLDMLEDLFRDNYDTFSASSGISSIEIVKKNPNIAVVVMDIKMGGMDGIVAARQLKEINSDIRIIFHTGFPGDYDEDEISDKEKPFDYIEKGEPISRLTRSVQNAVESYRLLKDNQGLYEYAESMYGMIGKSDLMREVYQLIRKIAPGDNKVMLYGETGTGKEKVAQAIHCNSPRRDNHIAVLNCDPQENNLMETELFGHVRGTFTNAYETRMGLFEYANGGTVFIDEIGDLNINTQARLLRVLECGEYCKVGSPEIRKTDIRIICATNKNLEQLVQTGKFREDLYYRLKGHIITLPPLRQRREDIPLLVEKFKDMYINENRLSPKIFDQEAINFFINFDWPGNVRELREAIESSIDLADSDIIFLNDVLEHFKISTAQYNHNNGKRGSLRVRVKEFERNCIIEALNETHDNNVSAAAKILQMDRANLSKLIIKYKINTGK